MQRRYPDKGGQGASWWAHCAGVLAAGATESAAAPIQKHRTQSGTNQGLEHKVSRPAGSEGNVLNPVATQLVGRLVGRGRVSLMGRSRNTITHRIKVNGGAMNLGRTQGGGRGAGEGEVRSGDGTIDRMGAMGCVINRCWTRARGRGVGRRKSWNGIANRMSIRSHIF